MTTVTRRDFIKVTSTAGGGLVLAFFLPGCERREGAAAAAAFEPNAWIRIAGDGTVTLIVDRSEMGQGVTTSLPMLLAEELEVDFDTVRFEFAPADAVYTNSLFGIQGTGGSTSVRAGWEPLRKAGGAARTMLIAAAAERWGVPAHECRAESGSVIHPASDRTAGYGELADAAARRAVPDDVPLKQSAEFRLLGNPHRRLDTPDKVDGSAIFGIDVRRPGMLTAMVARCPVFGGNVASFNDASARAVPGVKEVMQISSGVAVVADDYWAALQGRRALEIEWDEGEWAEQSSEAIRESFRRLAERPGAVARNDGDTEAALAQAQTRHEAVYDLPYLAHATMEPMNATADVRSDGCDVWAPTQFQTACQQRAAEITGLALENVRVHTTFLGGGFGRRFEVDFVSDAVEASRAVGAPVKVVWSREDDVQHDYYRPASHHAFRAGLDSEGRPVAWTHRIVAPSIMLRASPDAVQDGLDAEAVEGAVGLPYAIPNVHVDYHHAEVGVPVGFWRSVNHSYNAYAVECFVEELARASDADPVEYRQRLLDEAPRHRRVLELAAEEAGWGRPLPRGHAHGIAVHESFGSFVAEVAEVSVEGGRPRVHRVVAAVDCGPTVNPTIIEAQIESAICYGLTAVLYGAIDIENGRARQSNFHDYRMLRIDEMPDVEVHIVPSSDSLGGVGEVGTPPIAPAVVNALYALRGRPIRRLPISL